MAYKKRTGRIGLGKREGVVSIIGNLVLSTGKFYVGLMGNSLAIMADAFHTLFDSISSIALVIGLQISRRPGNAKRPFGYGRAESLTSLFIGFILGAVAFEFFIGGIERLYNHQSVEYTQAALVVTVISIVVKELMAQYAFWIARKTKLNSVRADGWHHRSDAISSVVVLIGILFSGKYWWMDGVLGMVVALILFHSCWDILKGAIGPLLGISPPKQMMALAKKAAEECIEQHSFRMHRFKLHQYGDHCELTFHLQFMESDISLEKAHSYSRQIERKLRPHLIVATIHLEPME